METILQSVPLSNIWSFKTINKTTIF